MIQGIKILVNDSFTTYNRKRTENVELANGVELTVMKAVRQRLQIISEEGTREQLIAAVEIEIDVLSYAAEQYAGLDSDAIFDSLSSCIEDLEKLREKLLSMEG